MAHSADLQWLLLRNNNSYIVKRNGVALTAEPGNLLNKPSYKNCGMINRKAIAVTKNKDGQVVLKTKRGTRVNNKAWASKTLSKSKFAGKKHQAAVAILAAAQTRPDLAAAAVARYHALKGKKN